MSTRLLILGLDGAGYSHVAGLVDAGELPNIRSLAAEGSFGPLISTTPPITGPAWLGLASGLDVDQTGIPDFLIRSGAGFGLRPISSRDFRGRTIWDALSSVGARVAVFNFPMLYPPYPLEGLMVSGFGTDESTQWTYPDTLKAELLSEVGADYGLTVNYHHAIYDDCDRFLDDLEASLTRRLKAAEYLCRKGPWDLFFCVLSETDWLLHRCWSDLDPDSPLHDAAASPRRAERARRIWRRIDDAIPRLREACGDDTSVLLCSDHGFGPNTRTVCINGLLEQTGLLVRRSDSARTGAAIRRVGAAAAQRAGAVAARVGGPVGRVLSRVRRRGRRYLPKDDSGYLLATIDQHASVAFDPGHTIPFGGLYLSPRFERGGVEYMTAIDRVEDALANSAFDNGLDLAVRRCWLDSAERPASLPDLLVSGDDWGVTFSKTDFSDTWLVDGPFSTRHTGSHRIGGLYLAAGQAFTAGPRGRQASILDIAPTVLTLFGLAPPDDRRGHPLPTARGVGATRPAVLDGARAEDFTEPSSDDDADVRERLRGLGYIE